MLVRSEKTCVSEGESPSSLEARLPEFGTKVMNEKSNQLPKTEGCLAEGEPVDLGTTGTNDRREAYPG